LKSLDSTVAEISRGSQYFWGAPVAHTSAKFGPKCSFWQPTPQTQVVYQI